ncbi:MAG: N-acetylornithine carbamoyltransferase [Alphaproteobacteria bacterium]|nr:N-acetylornithine carbamoyltransferase [Alphaproteobacteria bacterium]
MSGGHVLRPADLDDATRVALVARARALKAADPVPVPSRLRVGALYFDPSLRTRASFEQAARVLGGSCQTLNAGNDTWTLELDPDAVMDGAAVENVVEAARVLGRLFHVLGVRAFRGARPWAVDRTEPVISAIAAHAGVPVISLEGASHHPCQGLADLVTLHEQFGDDLSGLPVALCWAFHPRALPPAVPHTFLEQAALAGCDVTVAHPPGFDLDPEVVAQARAAAEARGGGVRVSHDRAEALAGRRVVYVKSWGPLDDRSPTDPALRPWLVDEAALAPAPEARVMHCLPVRRNVVLSGALLDGPRSLVTEQAGNRLWAQAALLELVAQRTGVLS